MAAHITDEIMEHERVHGALKTSARRTMAGQVLSALSGNVDVDQAARTLSAYDQWQDEGAAVAPVRRSPRIR